ncbi:hypothetical protein GOV13_03415, partial [Candidatus Pacearchaeota archaeon]|nr:hypothetical protein [Candidatus Pacearchaeota archaeon]
MKKLMVSFVALMSVLFLVATVSAAAITAVEVDGVDALVGTASVVAGETVTIKVWFNAEENASDVRVKAEIEGEKVDVDARTAPFDVEDGLGYKKTLTLKIPYELKDEVSEDIDLNLKVWNGDFRDEATMNLRVQRPSYNAEVKSVTASQTVEAGEAFPVDVVLKNMGYNDLDDLYVTASIPALSVAKTLYFGDLVAMEDDDDDEDTMTGRLYLSIPHNAE